VILLLLATVHAADRAPPPLAAAVPPAPPPVWVGALSSGAPVWIAPRHGLPIVRVELSLDTTTLRAGLAPGALDALGAVWGEGSGAGGSWRASLDRIGAAAAIGCGPTRCWAALEAPSEAAAEALAALGERVRAPSLAPRAVEQWRRAHRADWRTDWLAPGLVHARAVGRLLWPDGHPTRADRRAEDFTATTAEVRAAWRAVLADAPAHVVVAGDLTPEAALPVLEAAFGGLGRPPEALPSEALPPLGAAPRHVFVDAPGANQGQISVSWPSPAAGDLDAPAYALAFRAVAVGFGSRMNLRLRERDGLSYRVEGADDEGRSTVTLAVDPTRMPAALGALAAELDAATAGLTAAEVDASRRQAWAAGAEEVSTLAGISNGLWRDARAGASPGDTWRALAVYQDVSVSDVSAAAARWFATPRIWVVSGDAEIAEPALDEAGWGIDLRWGACSAVYGGGCPR